MSMTIDPSVIDPTTGGGRSTRGRTPVTSVMVNGAALDVTVNEMMIGYTEEQHDNAMLTCVSPTLENTEGLIDSAIQFYFGVAPRAGLFQGYITDVTREQTAQGQLSFTLTLLGPTKVLNTGKPRFWSNKTATGAISDIVNANLLGYYGTPQDYRWRSLSQTEETDWRMVLRLASLKLGWSIFSRYGIVLAYDPNKLYADCAPYCRLVSFSGADEMEGNDRHLIDFTANEEAEMETQNLGKMFGYFTSADEVQTRKQPGEFKGYTFETGITICDQDEATAYVTAADTSINGQQWRNHGIARIWGDADIYPGQCVDVRTAKTERYVKTDGKWLVRAVTHQADRQSYQTQLLLSRPVKWSTMYGASQYRPFWEEDMTSTRARPYLSLNSDYHWMSSWASSTAAAAV